MYKSVFKTASFVEHLIFLSEKIILNLGVRLTSVTYMYIYRGRGCIMVCLQLTTHSLLLLYHLQLLHRHLNISQAIAAECSPLYIASVLESKTFVFWAQIANHEAILLLLLPFFSQSKLLTSKLFSCSCCCFSVSQSH